jgi:hypothetical protein
MGKDSWNLMFGQSYPPVTRKGTEVQMHQNEDYGSQMVPGYSGTSRSKENPFGRTKSIKPKKRK